MKQLPDKPSELIMLALGDLVKTRNNPNYLIEMGEWICDDPFYNGKCAVCLAGSTMVQTLEANEHGVLYPWEYSEDIENKLRALDSFREGYVIEAFDLMKMRVPRGIKDYYRIVDYKQNPEKFLMQMTDMANSLAKEGL